MHGAWLKKYANKHNYPVSANRELVAFGICNIVGVCDLVVVVVVVRVVVLGI
jgi:hypothetical protein